jgi:RNA-directed DNA polymerase
MRRRAESFDFLGYTFGPMVFRRTGETYVGVTPSKKRVKRSHTPSKRLWRR